MHLGSINVFGHRVGMIINHGDRVIAPWKAGFHKRDSVHVLSNLRPASICRAYVSLTGF